MVVLERASRWFGTNARPDRRTRGRFQGMHSGNQDGQAARLSGGDQHDCLQGSRHAGARTNVRLPFRSWRGWSHHYARIRLRRRQERHDQTAQFASGKFLSYPCDDGGEVPKGRGMDESIYFLRNADLFRISRGQTRSDVFGMGDPNAEHPRLERAMLFDDRRALRELRGVTGENRMGPLRRRERSRARQPLRELHGALRLRTDGDTGLASAARRHLEDDQVQLRFETETFRPWQRSPRVQWRQLW